MRTGSGRTHCLWREAKPESRLEAPSLDAVYRAFNQPRASDKTRRSTLVRCPAGCVTKALNKNLETGKTGRQLQYLNPFAPETKHGHSLCRASLDSPMWKT